MKKYAVFFLLTLYINLTLCYPDYFNRLASNWQYILQLSSLPS